MEIFTSAPNNFKIENVERDEQKTETIIIFELQTENGMKRNIRMSSSQLQNIQNNVCSLLKQTIVLKSKLKLN